MFSIMSLQERLKEVDWDVLKSSLDAEAFPTDHPLHGVSRQEMVQEMQRRMYAQNEDRRAAQRALWQKQDSRIDATFAHLPPLPGRLPKGTADFYSKDDGVTLFYQFCEEGRLEGVQTWVDANNPPLERLEGGLVYAAENNHAHVMRHLFQRGCKLTSQVLYGACTKPSLDVFKLLVEEQGWHPNQCLFSSEVALLYVLYEIAG
jgi:hypothetical protein